MSCNLQAVLKYTKRLKHILPVHLARKLPLSGLLILTSIYIYFLQKLLSATSLYPSYFSAVSDILISTFHISIFPPFSPSSPPLMPTSICQSYCVQTRYFLTYKANNYSHFLPRPSRCPMKSWMWGSIFRLIHSCWYKCMCFFDTAFCTETRTRYFFHFSCFFRVLPYLWAPRLCA